MGLVEVTGLVHGVQDGYPIAQQVGRVAGPFDLAEQICPQSLKSQEACRAG